MFERLAGALPAGRVGTADDARRRRSGSCSRTASSPAPSCRSTAATGSPPPDRARDAGSTTPRTFAARVGPVPRRARGRAQPRARAARPAPRRASALRLRSRPSSSPRTADGVVGCLLRTPPHGVVLSRFDVARGGRRGRRGGPRHAPGPPRSGRPGRRHRALRRRVVASRRAPRRRSRSASASTPQPQCASSLARPGACARRGPDDIADRSSTGSTAFADEALGEAPHVEDVEATYRRRRSDPDGAWLLWDDGGPVSLAGLREPDADRNARRPRLHAARAARAAATRRRSSPS